jgi:hypothetical protein
MMSDKERKAMYEKVNGEFLARISVLLVGKTIVGVSNPSVSSGVDEEEVIQEYVELAMSDGTNVRIGMDYEEIDILVYDVDSEGRPVDDSVIARGDYIPEE